MMRCRKGYTIVEILIVLIIMGIMAALSLGKYGKSPEVEKKARAINNLRTIYNIEKRYRLDAEPTQYFPPDTGTCVAANTAAINAATPAGLGLFIRDSDFTYSITGDCSGATTTGYTATATRSSGPCATNTITLTSAGGEPVVTNVVNCADWR